MITNPCYDPVTKTDCPHRTQGCAKNCPWWKDYVTERDADYKERRDSQMVDHYKRDNGRARALKKARRSISMYKEKQE